MSHPQLPSTGSGGRLTPLSPRPVPGTDGGMVYPAPALLNAYHDRMILTVPEISPTETMRVEYKPAIGGGTWSIARGDLAPASYFYATQSPYARVFVMGDMRPSTSYFFRVVVSNGVTDRVGQETPVPLSTVSQAEAYGKLHSLYEGRMLAERGLKPQLDTAQRDVARLTTEARFAVEKAAKLQIDLAEAEKRETAILQANEELEKRYASDLKMMNQGMDTLIASRRAEEQKAHNAVAKAELLKVAVVLTDEVRDDVERQYAAAVEYIKEMEAELHVAKCAIAAFTDRMLTLQVEVDEAAAIKAEWAQTRSELETGRQKLNSDRDSMRAEVTRVSAELRGAEAQLADAYRQLTRVSSENEALQKELQEKQKSHTETVPAHLYHQVSRRLTDAERGLQQVLSEQAVLVEAAVTQSEQAKTNAVSAVQAQLSQAEAHLNEYRQQVAVYQTRIAQLEQENLKFKSTPVAVGVPVGLQAVQSPSPAETELAKLQEAHGRLRTELDTQTRANETLRTQLTSSQDRIRESEARYQRLFDDTRARETESRDTAVALASIQHTALKGERDRLLAQLQSNQSAVASGQSEVTRERDELRVAVDRHRVELATMEGRVTQAEATILRETRERAEMSERLVKTNGDLRESLRALATTTAQFNADRARMQLVHDTLAREKSALETRVAELQGQVDTLTATANMPAVDVRSQDRIAALERELVLTVQDGPVRQLAAERDRLKAEVSRLTRELEVMQERVESSTKELAAVKQERDTLTNRLAGAGATIESLRKGIDDSRPGPTAAIVPAEMYQQVSQRLTETETRLQRTLQEVTSLQQFEQARLADQNMLEWRVKEAEQRLTTQQQRITQLEEENTKLRTNPPPSVTAELTSLQEAHGRLRTELDTQTRANETLRTQLTSSQDRIRECEARYQRLFDDTRARETESRDTAVALASIRAEHTALKGERDRLLAQLQSNQSAVASGQSEVARERDELRVAVDRHRVELATMEGRVTQAEATILRETRERAEMSERLVKTNGDLRECLRALATTTASYNAERTRLTAERDAALNERARLQGMVTELQGQAETLTAAANMPAVDPAGRVRIAELERQLAAKSELCTAATARIQQFIKELDEVRDQLREHRERVQTIQVALREAETKAQRALDTKDTYLSDVALLVKPQFIASASTTANVDGAVTCYLNLRRAGYGHDISLDAVLRYPTSVEQQTSHCRST